MNRIEITPKQYRAAAEALAERAYDACDSHRTRRASVKFEADVTGIKGEPHFFGTLAFDGDVYFSTVSAPDGDLCQISHAVPVWSEFHTYDENGDEVLNDFRFDELKKYLIES